jgi:hypothetical protein
MVVNFPIPLDVPVMKTVLDMDIKGLSGMQYLSVKGKKGNGKRERKNLYPLTFNLFPKINFEFKTLNQVVLEWDVERHNFASLHT